MTRLARSPVATPLRSPARQAAVAAFCLALTVAGCRGKEPASAVPAGASTSFTRAPVPPRRPSGKARANLIATVGARSVGPFLARHDGSAMAAFLGFGDDGVRRVSVIPLTPQGELRSGVRGLVPTPFDSADLAISPTNGPDSGYALLFSALTDRGKGLWAFGVTEEGGLRGPAAEITRTTNDIVWSDLVPTPRGALALWVDQAADGEGGLFAASLDPTGKLRGVPVRLAKGVAGWQVVAAGGQVQVAIAHARPGQGGEAAPQVVQGKASEEKKKPELPAPALSLMTLDADARVERAVPVAMTATVRGALEVARERGRTHVLWTDTSGTEPEVLAVTVDDQRGATPARRVADTRDGNLLVALAGGESGVAVVWERDVPESHGRRFVQVARLTDTPARRVTRLEVAPKSRVEIANAPDGFAVLASIRACSFAPHPAPDCAVAPFEPALLRADRDLTPLDVTPLEFGEDPPGLAWALGCPSGCLALSAAGASPARVRTAYVAARTAPATPLRDPTPTLPLASRMLNIETLASGEAVTRLAHLKLGTTNLVASLSADFELPGRANRAAVIRVRAFDEQGHALAADASTPTAPPSPKAPPKDPTVLSSRALAVGGLAMAPAGRPEDGGAVAWVGRQGAEPQVHITRIDARGRRTNEVVLTSSRGGATDVALAWVGDAWIVGWVDFRDGNGEVYATKVTPDLKRVVREERITRAPGDASGLQLLAAGRDRVFAAWSDAREAPREGFADIYLTQLRSHDATRLTEEVQLLPSVPHSRSPELMPAVGGGAGAIVAWIEQAPEGADPSRGGAYRALALRVDGVGKPVGVPVSLPVAGPGHPTAFSLESTPDGVRGVIARAHGAGITLDGVRGNFGSFTALPFGAVATPASSDFALLAFDGWVYFGEDGVAAHERRLRRAHAPVAAP